ncbi:Glycine/sarcosine N-methyltransferase [Saliniradius amylolyticus]|uniref:Glycine/sarcosine N-methyltransferase n=1 Tax=Saliniradius amylolyticus TaxID=2183582 RepID=A0A2S2E6F4_9ALTE|nr:methyltransferase domain-containing protein [Saliniradius amylolyticus]AWL12547.1 Glycine/sarcosine N-methyltransferase [Saliniradius amylolyticus]
MSQQSMRVQDYGSDPTSVRETGKYVEEYIQPFVDKWDELIDWDARAESEGEFFIQKLKERGAKKVLDVATGTGFHSVQLLKAGFEVTSVDGSAEMLSKAFENASRHGFTLRTVLADWRWLNRDIHDYYDAVICLGNSFTHLHDENDRRKALAEMYATLRHDGVLIMDQRNYDALLDEGGKPTHNYYYCGDSVRAEPDYLDPGLARFKYTFADGAVYYLNMFPLRRNYTRRLMQEVGFQRVTTYGDFEEEFSDSEPDFLIHVAEKRYEEGLTMTKDDDNADNSDSIAGSYQAALKKARDYYNSEDADNFYANIWGGEDIHVGIYRRADESIREASARTVKYMLNKLNTLNKDSVVLDIGSGYGGSARYIAANYGCKVIALNLAEEENKRARKLNEEQGLDHLIEVIDGCFEDIPLEHNSVDIVWSQDAILHSGNRPQALNEVNRVLKPGGEFIFTDPMQSDDCPKEVLEPIYQRIHLPNLGSISFYRQMAQQLGWEEVHVDDLTEQLTNHYSRVRSELIAHRDELKQHVSTEYMDTMVEGLGHWVEGGKNRHLSWGVLHFRKPE